MKVGDIVRRKATDKTFVGSYYCIVKVGVKYVYALKSNDDNDNWYLLLKRDFCKIPTAKIRVTNKMYNGIERKDYVKESIDFYMGNNTCKTIKYVL